MDSPLGLFLFQYLGLGVVFVIGLIYGFRQGDLTLARGRGRRQLLVLLGGMAVYLALHGYLQFVAARY